MRASFLLLPLLCCSFFAAAQYRAIGRWRAHLPYNAAQGVATDGTTIYTITPKGFFTYNPTNGELDAYSKVEGMHETGTTAIACDVMTGTVIIGYGNSNIDLFKSGTFTGLPDLKNKSFSGSKAINHIFADRGFGYVSTGLGVVVIDLQKEEVDETYTFSKGGQTLAAFAFTASDTFFYAATAGGLYRTPRSNGQPQVFSNWTAVDTTRTYNGLAIVGSTLFATSGDTVFSNNGSPMHRVFWRDSTTINRIDGGAQTLYVGMFTPKTGAGRTYHLSPDGAFTDSTRVAFPKGMAEMGGAVWAADLYQGLGKRRADAGIDLIVPNGPNSPDSYDIWVRAGEVWVAHGGIKPRDYSGQGSQAGLSSFTNDSWRAYQPYNFAPLADVKDIITLTKDERTGTVWAGSLATGLLSMTADGNSGYVVRADSLESRADDTSAYPATGLALDAAGNLWVAQNGARNELAVRTATGTWYHMSAPTAGRGAIRMLIDDAGYKWYFGPNGGGVTVYNDGGTPENPADDSYRTLLGGKGSGNIPANGVVRSIMKDRDGAVWIGTDDGVAIVSSPSCAITPTCDAELRPVQYDQFAGLLFKGESVRAMATDGGNRKWIGTTNGVWLLSPDANAIVSRFTVDNSPLPSNIIQSIAVDGVTGDVYIGTDQGLISYRGTATDGGESAGTVQVFPNPVTSDYSGPIAIRGLTADADVRITDVAGQLVYRARATGGQAVWNGLDYTGARPQSGVYLIFATNRDGTESSVGKLVLMH